MNLFLFGFLVYLIEDGGVHPDTCLLGFTSGSFTFFRLGLGLGQG
jgi:hypothetical protein